MSRTRITRIEAVGPSSDLYRGVFIARRYARAVLAMVLCQYLSVCPSNAGILSKRLDKSSWFCVEDSVHPYYTVF